MKQRQRQPTEIDDTEDRMGSVRELDFERTVEGRIGDQRPRREVENEFPPRRRRQIGMTGGETLDDSAVEDHVSMDDLAPETLIDEQGVETPLEPSDENPVDEELRIVHEREIGGGSGLDEAEKARVPSRRETPDAGSADDEPA